MIGVLGIAGSSYSGKFLRGVSSMTDKILSRAVVYGIEATKGHLCAVAVADPMNRTVCSFIGPGLKDLPAELVKYDALIGLDIDNLLRKLGLAP